MLKTAIVSFGSGKGYSYYFDDELFDIRYDSIVVVLTHNDTNFAIARVLEVVDLDLRTSKSCIIAVLSKAKMFKDMINQQQQLLEKLM